MSVPGEPIPAAPRPSAAPAHTAMPGLVPGIHVLRRRGASRERMRRWREVDARNQSGHDDDGEGEARKFVGVETAFIDGHIFTAIKLQVAKPRALSIKHSIDPG